MKRWVEEVLELEEDWESCGRTGGSWGDEELCSGTGDTGEVDRW